MESPPLRGRFLTCELQEAIGLCTTVLTKKGHVYQRDTPHADWQRVPTASNFLFYEVHTHTIYNVDTCARKVKPLHKDNNCKTIVRCQSVASSDVLAMINVLGSNPKVLSLSEIPAGKVTFQGNKGSVFLPPGPCSVLLYESFLQYQCLLVAVIFIRQPTIPPPVPGAALLAVSSVPTLPVFDLQNGDSATLPFTNCVTNLGASPATDVTLTGIFYSVYANLVVDAVTVPPDCTLTGPFSYQCGPFTLAPGEKRCFDVAVEVTCTGMGSAAVSNTVDATGTGLVTVTADAATIINCMQNPACAFLPCNGDITCGGIFPCPPSTGATFTVDPLSPPSPTNFSSIQAAINAAPSNTTIIVSPGLYIEEIIVPVGKDNITLQSSLLQGVNIQSLTQGATVVTVDGAQCFILRDFRILMPAQVDRSGVGVSVINGASATIANNTITTSDGNVPISSDPNGTGINVGAGSAAAIITNRIDSYQKTGILVNGLGACANVFNNVVVGVGPTDVIGQNGIQISRGASAIVEGNSVTNNLYTDTQVGLATGILVFEESATNPVCIQSTNVASNNNIGLALGTAEGVLTQGNIFSENNTFGIYVSSDSTNNTFIRNTALNNGVLDIIDLSQGFASALTANIYLCNECLSDNKNGAICASQSPLPEPPATNNQVLDFFLPTGVPPTSPLLPV